MPTITLSLLTTDFYNDFSEEDPAYLSHTATEAIFVTSTGLPDRVLFLGSGIDFQMDGTPTAGTLTGLEFYFDNVLSATAAGFSFDLVEYLEAEADAQAGDSSAQDALFAPFDFVVDATAITDSVVNFFDNEFVLGDTAIAGAGGSYMELGEYADTYIAGDGFDRIGFAYEFGGQGAVVNLGTGQISDTYGNTESMSGQFDALTGSFLDDNLRGDSNDNVIEGLQGNDTLNGRGGIDMVKYDNQEEGFGFYGVTVNLMTGNATDEYGTFDTLSNFENVTATDLADTIVGNDVDNILYGLDGNDLFIGHEGDDQFIGGQGSDTVSYADASGGVNLYLTNSGNDVGSSEGKDVFDSIENLSGSEFNDRINGDANANELSGFGGHDTIKGNGGQDTFYGANGNDKIQGGNDVDYMDGGYGTDVLVGYDGNDAQYGSFGNDSIFGGRGNDLILGEDGDDALRGNKGNDTIDGGFGSDRMYGGSGSDLMEGFEDVDYILGERGNDTIEGGEGNDKLTGGTGADVFVMDFGGGYDAVRDFEDGTDLMDVSKMGINDFSQVTTSAVTAGVKVDMGGGDIFLLEGAALADINGSDFIFAF